MLLFLWLHTGSGCSALHGVNLNFKKSLLYEHELEKPLHIVKFQYCKFVEDSSWFNIHWKACVRKLNEKSGKTGAYIHLYLPYKNSNSWNMTHESVRLLNKNNQWTITLLSHISLYATVLVFLHRHHLQCWKIVFDFITYAKCARYFYFAFTK